ncbi:Methylenetetrahydrofolate reductase [Ostreococcus tauri]|uniref:Methylenetetrahydrofolate reductase n=1 Tax=Ostreococcus tauri TaxID=70448 RepID=A0A096P865_OSTTA|nr:Methylenetetrahydrofolate reductase [Ostreococcus tauri]CEG00412.1 Methylenetetrahydrofolate reductase [Ostreococcus tauri]|eukprot:XP_022840365.1 Methylenetetrahydrofolate reductase [Ostreococcus tauri]
MTLVDALMDPSRPVFLFGTTPPLDGSSADAEREAAENFANKARGLAADGYIVYDIQEEKGRTEDARPFPFRKLADPGSFAKALKRATNGGESVVYKCVAETKSEEAFKEWLADATRATTAYNLVGGASSSQEYAGPTIARAAEMLKEANKKCAFGGVTIAERHAKKGNEHETLCAKAAAGAEWFISQAIYDADMTIKLVNDYGAECKKRNIKPKKIVLTFAPCGREKTMKFIKWLGCSVPEAVEQEILTAQNPAQKSVEVLVAMCARIIEETKDSGVPLGVSVESVSIFKNEKEAAHDLFRLTQAVMLDAYGLDWSMRYTIGGKPTTKTEKPSITERQLGDENVAKRVAVATAAFLAGVAVRGVTSRR